MMAQRSFTPQEKRDAVDKVLTSETFARSEQLRHFLQYVCEMEMDGRSNELKEYMIGVDVLRRPKGYSPAHDSSVRSRAHELRHRLERYYEREAPNAQMRIELRKGSYVPVFVEPTAATHVVPHEPAIEIRDSPARPRRWPLAVAFLLGALAMLIAALIYRRSLPTAGIDPIVQEAWGPFAQRPGNVLVCVGSYLHMIVRPNWQETPGGEPKFDAVPELYSYFQKQRPLKPGVELFMHPTENSLDFGELKAVVTVTNTLRSLGVGYQLLPERVTSLAALSGRNAILLGNSQISNLANEELLRAIWTIDFEPRLGRIAIVDQKAKDRPAPFVGTYGKPGEPSWCCGLITVLPADGPGTRARTLIISGITATGTEAATEYVASPAALRDLQLRFAREGISGFPSAYQVVVKCRSKDTFLLSSEYAAHQVLIR